MVDKQARSDLANSLNLLVSGEMTNDAFDDAYYGRWHDSEDAAVVAIASFGYELYSSDLPLPYRLKGRYAVSHDERELARHAMLFLQTELEYEWPRNVHGIVPYWCLWGPGCYLVLGSILFFIAWADGGFPPLLFGIPGLLAIMCTVHWLFTYPSRVHELEHFHKSGDFRVWPFLRQADFDAAEKSPR